MSILKSILGQLTNRVGNVVMYNANGNNIMRSVPANVKNPRSSAQMEQRVKLAPLVAFYRANREWMRKGFESKPRNWSIYNAFVHANIAASPVCFTKQQADAGAAIVAPWQVTRGSLVPYSLNLVGGKVLTDLFLGSTFAFGDTTTVGQFSTAVIANNNNDREGDQLSIVVVTQGTNPGNGMPYLSVKAYEVILNKTDEQLLSKFLPQDILEKSAGALAINVEAIDGAVTMIQSRTENGTLRVSTQSLVVTDDAIMEPYRASVQGDAAAASYGDSGEVFLDNYSANSQGTAVASFTISNFTYKGTPIPAGSYAGLLASNAAFSVRVSNPDALATTGAIKFMDGTGSQIASIDKTDLTIAGKVVSGNIPSGSPSAVIAQIVVNGDGEAASLSFSTTDPNSGGGGNNDPGGIE